MITPGGAGEASGGRSRLARAGALTLALAVAAGLGLLAGACGGSSGPGVAEVDSTQTTTTGSGAQGGSSSADPAAYAACMRRNGVPKFPDPDANGRLNIQAGPGLDPNSPRYKAAEKACEKHMPRGGDDTPSPEEQAEELRRGLRYSACMREHGVRNFPDPKMNAEGGLDLSGDGVNPDSPQYKAAEQACKDLAPGANGAQSERSAP